MNTDEHGAPLVLDANVLIDYIESDLAILALASEMRTIYVTVPILEEVDRLDEGDCDEFGLTVADLTTEQAVRAGEGGRRLSFEDRTCLVLAQDEGLTVVTNDTRLRADCREAGIDVLWGLEIMVHLVADGRLPQEDAVDVAEVMQAANPLYLTDEILEEFRDRIRSSASCR